MGDAVDAGPRYVDAHAVGADDAGATTTRRGDDFVLQLAAVRAEFGETGSVDDGELDAARRAVPDDAEQAGSGDDDVGEVNFAGDFSEARVASESEDLLFARVDRVEVAGIAGVPDLGQERVAALAGILRCADDGQGGRAEQFVE